MACGLWLSALWRRRPGGVTCDVAWFSGVGIGGEALLWLPTRATTTPILQHNTPILFYHNSKQTHTSSPPRAFVFHTSPPVMFQPRQSCPHALLMLVAVVLGLAVQGEKDRRTATADVGSRTLAVFWPPNTHCLFLPAAAACSLSPQVAMVDVFQQHRS